MSRGTILQYDILHFNLPFVSLMSFSVLISVIKPVILMILKPWLIINIARVNLISILYTFCIL